MKIISVVGARPNFMKIAPFIKALNRHNEGKGKKIEHLLVHTGQHYDDRMSQAFFTELDIPEADINLGIGSGSHAEQVGGTMIEFEKVLRRHRPGWVVVVGDVNATLACSVTAKKEKVRCCHIEAGLRSGDRTMPEEINRVVTDSISDLLFVSEPSGLVNLFREGFPIPEQYSKYLPPELSGSDGALIGDSNSLIRRPVNHSTLLHVNKYTLPLVFFVGNIMIDTLDANFAKAQRLDLDGIVTGNAIATCKTALKPENFAVMTLHRPSNVDDPRVLAGIVDFVTGDVLPQMPLVWSIHPRAEKMLRQHGLWEKVSGAAGLILTRPLGYLSMLRLNSLARMVLTDSGGLQEECTVLGTPCLTLRWNTERPITLRENGGASILVGNDLALLRRVFGEALDWQRRPHRPDLWDGHTAERIVALMADLE